jgi:predicted protein tyrosine phosphatase
LEFEVKSTGIYHGYPEKLNEKLLKWADRIFVMDLSQKLFIYKNYKKHFDKVEVIGISDQYSADSPELNELIEFWVKKREILYELKI